MAPQTSPSRTPLRRLARGFAEIVVAIYLILDAIVRALLRPVTLLLNRLQIVAKMEAFIASLPAYAVLVMLILPFAVAEPAKIYAVYLITIGHKVMGLIVLALAYLVSVLVVDRIFHAGKAKLLSIAWFAKLWDWISDLKDRFMTWMKSTTIWRRASEIKARLRQMLSRWRVLLRRRKLS